MVDVAQRHLVVHLQVHMGHCLVLCTARAASNNSGWLIWLWHSSSDQRLPVLALSATAPQPRREASSLWSGLEKGVVMVCRSTAGVCVSTICGLCGLVEKDFDLIVAGYGEENRFFSCWWYL